jgi:hypothetical protein
MSASVQTTRDAAANPLDIMEQIVSANDWAFDRRGEAEMVGLRALFQLVAGNQHHALHLHFRSEGAGEATNRPV